LTPGELRLSKQLVQFLMRNGAHEEFEYSTDGFFSPEDIMNHFHECDRRELTPQTLLYIAQKTTTRQGSWSNTTHKVASLASGPRVATAII
jgi:hypothetical protein